VVGVAATVRASRGEGLGRGGGAAERKNKGTTPVSCAGGWKWKWRDLSHIWELTERGGAGTEDGRGCWALG